MLLTPKEKPDHILVSAKPENGDIPVGYVPFVIGKHTGLADHILDKPTVSRFHVRIMEKGGDYFGKHEMEKNFKTSVRDQCDCNGGTAMVLV